MSLNVLVVGGAGYIGSHMVLTLKDRGHHPVVLDNLSRGYADAVSGAPLVVADLLDPKALRTCFKSHHIDVVMHFAALAYVGESVLKPERYYMNNVTGTLNLLEAMHEHGCRHFIFSSTCATYGEPDYLPIDESHPQRPINPYGHSKLMIEQVLRDYSLAHQLNSVSLRYFNAAGADTQLRAGERHDPETHLLPLVLAEAMRLLQGGRPEDSTLKVFGNDFDTPDGSCVRDYIHVSDLCQAHMLAAEQLASRQLQGAHAFNLANGNGYSVLEVIEVCRRITGQPIQYSLEGRRPGDPGRLIGAARKAQEVLGWTQQFDALNQMVQSAWAWMLAGKPEVV